MSSALRRCAAGRAPRAAAMATLMLVSAGSYASCGSAFCTVNTSWDAMGFSAEAGGRFDLRYEYINQDKPRAGSTKVAVGQIPQEHDEVRTVNRNWIATLDYAFSQAWGASLVVPIGDRDHVHIANDLAPPEPESWTFTKLGDVRVLGRYQFHSQSAEPARMSVAGINFGLKFPTGKFDVKNSGGETAERTLQPGSGTTDIILGGHYRQSLLTSNFSWFAQVLYQQALNSRQDFRPGERLSLDAGLRYEASDRLGLLLQANFLVRARDRGNQAEPEHSGGKLLFLSPGLSFAVTRDVQVYGFVQLPIYQYVNGVQLTADRSAVIGISSRF